MGQGGACRSVVIGTKQRPRRYVDPVPDVAGGRGGENGVVPAVFCHRKCGNGVEGVGQPFKTASSVHFGTPIPAPPNIATLPSRRKIRGRRDTFATSLPWTPTQPLRILQHPHLVVKPVAGDILLQPVGAVAKFSRGHPPSRSKTRHGRHSFATGSGGRKILKGSPAIS